MQKRHVELSEADRQELLDLLKQSSLTRKLFRRASALLELDRGATFLSVASQVGVGYRTVSIWSKKYSSSGLDFLQDQHRAGRPVKVSGDVRAKITALACSDAPEGYQRWSLRLLADRAVELGYTESISHSEVGIILKKMNCSLTGNATGASEE